MNVDQDDIDVIYENLISQYVGGEEAIVYLFRSKSPTLRENMNQAMTEYDDAFTPVEQDFILHALEQRVIAASKKTPPPPNEQKKTASAPVSEQKKTPLTLSDEQKKQVQRFYGTNAGASFINTQMRNAHLEPDRAIPPTYPNLDSAVAAAAKAGASEGNVTFSTAGRLAIKQAFALGDVQKVMRAALEGGEGHSRTPQYRGTRVPRSQLEAFKVGDILVNTFFMSFSPDITKPTKRGDDEKVHDGFKQAMKFVGNRYKSHVGEPVIYELPDRSGYTTTVIHSLYEYETVMQPMEKLAIDSIKNEGTYTRICLKKKSAVDADAKKNSTDKPLYMFH
ncbi:Uncharacterised protein [Serratia odorifera]|uniref:Uncharacterized protein n=1 Tax=Serratia odorifera TaxID=618 RepID=A0A447KK45_SEROD|nr:hypothetical protein [Serratia odorifera]RII74069.1 hypothetical protein DX901_00495 [Serratia odorifera]VDZ51358.1 Uncharacterised protein [Serratia odorifera]